VEHTQSYVIPVLVIKFEYGYFWVSYFVRQKKPNLIYLKLNVAL